MYNSTATGILGIESTYGAALAKQPDDTWRVWSMNICMMPSDHTVPGKVKIDQWRKLVTTGCEINFLYETNKDMVMVRDKEKTENIVRGWFEGTNCRDECLKNTVFNELPPNQEE